MPIEVRCSQCGKRLRAGDDQAGKKARCPQCKAELLIAAPVASAASPTATVSRVAGSNTATVATGTRQPVSKSGAASSIHAGGQTSSRSSSSIPVAKMLVTPIEREEWHVTTGDQQQFGPVKKSELDAWVTEGRLDATCQVLCDGWENWKWAEELYPELAQPAAAEAPVQQAAPATATGFPVFADPAAAANPFAAPVSTPASSKSHSHGHDDVIGSKGIRRALAETRPWIMLFAVLLFLTAGLMALMGLGGLVAGLSVGAAFMVMALMYLCYAGLYGTAAYYLLTYAQRISAYLKTESTKNLEAALVAQKSFWKLMGIVTALFLSLAVVLLLVLVVGGGMAAFMGAQQGFHPR